MDSNTQKIRDTLEEYKKNLPIFIPGTVLVLAIFSFITLLGLAMFWFYLLPFIIGYFLPWLPTGLRIASGSGHFYNFGDFNDALVFLLLIGPCGLYYLRNSIKNIFFLFLFSIEGYHLNLDDNELEIANHLINSLPVGLNNFYIKYPDKNSKKILHILYLTNIIEFKYKQIMWTYRWRREKINGNL